MTGILPFAASSTGRSRQLSRCLRPDRFVVQHFALQHCSDAAATTRQRRGGFPPRRCQRPDL